MINDTRIVRIGDPLTLHIIAAEEIKQRRMCSVHIHIPGPEVDRPRQGAVNAAQINNQFTVHIQPEIIVTGEFEDDIMPPVVQAIGGLGKAGFQFYAEIEIRGIGIFYKIQILVLPRITVRQRISDSRIKILPVHRGKTSRLDIVEGQELPMLQGVLIRTVISTKLFINREITVKARIVVPSRGSVQTGKILGTVKLIIAGSIMDAFDEEMVDFPGILEEIAKRSVCVHCRGIAILSKVRA